MLQAQFSLLYNESLQVKTQLDEARGLLLATKNSHLRHIEHMEVRPLNGWGPRVRIRSLGSKRSWVKVRDPLRINS